MRRSIAALFAYSTNYLVDVQAGIVVDVEATAANRTQEVEATKKMIERVEERLEVKPKHLIGDTAYGAAPMLGWLVQEKQIESTQTQVLPERPGAQDPAQRSRGIARCCSRSVRY